MTCEQLDRFIQALRRELALQVEQAEGIEATVLGRVLEAVHRADTSALGHSNMRALAGLGDAAVCTCARRPFGPPDTSGCKVHRR